MAVAVFAHTLALSHYDPVVAMIVVAALAAAVAAGDSY